MQSHMRGPELGTGRLLVPATFPGEADRHRSWCIGSGPGAVVHVAIPARRTLTRHCAGGSGKLATLEQSDQSSTSRGIAARPTSARKPRSTIGGSRRPNLPRVPTQERPGSKQGRRQPRHVRNDQEQGSGEQIDQQRQHISGGVQSLQVVIEGQPHQGDRQHALCRPE